MVVQKGSVIYDIKGGSLHLFSFSANVHANMFSQICSFVLTCYFDQVHKFLFLQIYYSFYGFDDPILYKSEQQQQLLSHNRHPIFLAPTLILWAVPVMTYDRLLVAVMLPLYLGLASNMDRWDVGYVSEQFNMKKLQLLENGAKKMS